MLRVFGCQHHTDHAAQRMPKDYGGLVQLALKKRQRISEVISQFVATICPAGLAVSSEIGGIDVPSGGEETLLCCQKAASSEILEPVAVKAVSTN